jgi:hypothetical protein
MKFHVVHCHGCKREMKSYKRTLGGQTKWTRTCQIQMSDEGVFYNNKWICKECWEFIVSNINWEGAKKWN